jgi:hypothetical protein
LKKQIDELKHANSRVRVKIIADFIKINALFLIFAVIVSISGGANASESGSVSEVDIINEKIRKMEIRHQQEMTDLRNQVKSLIKKKSQDETNPGHKLNDRLSKLEQKVETSLQQDLSLPKNGILILAENWSLNSLIQKVDPTLPIQPRSHHLSLMSPSLMPIFKSIKFIYTQKSGTRIWRYLARISLSKPLLQLLLKKRGSVFSAHPEPMWKPD